MAPKPEQSPLSILGRLRFLPIFAFVLGSSLSAAVGGLFVSKKHRPPTYFKWVLYSAFRPFFALQTSEQEQFLNPTTRSVYEQYCKQQKIKPQIETVGEGKTPLLWLGDEQSDNVLLYFHGGGYNLSLSPAHLDFLETHLLWLKSGSRPRSIAAVVLEYDVAPFATYPRQLSQAAQALNHLLESRSPRNILIGGDSAGGHLTVDLLMHILQPHPDSIVPRVNLSTGQKLNAALLLSPWVDQTTSSESFKRNAWKDFIAVPSLERWSSNFIGTAPRDIYIDPCTTPRGFWTGLSDIIGRVYISSGSDEVLIDGINAFESKIKSEWKGQAGAIKYEEVQGDPHDPILGERLLGNKGESIKVDGIIRNWLEEAVST